TSTIRRSPPGGSPCRTRTSSTSAPMTAGISPAGPSRCRQTEQATSSSTARPPSCPTSTPASTPRPPAAATAPPGSPPRDSGDSVVGVLADPADAARVYAVLHTWGGWQLRATADGGTTWTTHALPDAPYRALAGDPRNPRRLWLGTDTGLARSDDGGATFTQV